MSRKLINWMFILAACLMTTAQGASIIWVDEGAADSFPTWQALLEGAGHTVTQMSDMRVLDQGKIDAMNAADLVIVGRDTDSGQYDDGDEIAQWNGLTVPLIQTSVYLIRSSRWLWVNDTGTPGVTDNMVIAENHSIFKGVGQAGDDLPMVTTLTNISGTTDGGNGQVLATHTDGRLWITYWEAEVEFYAGSGQMGASPRMWFAAGLNENSADKGNMNFTEDGQKIFLNAVDFMTGGGGSAASGPNPEGGVDDVIRDSVLSWIPNEYPGTHNLYLGTSFDDVNTMTVPTVSGLDVNSFDPDRLDFDQTYFWRVDEVNASPDKTVYKGNVWSFTAEPYSIQIPGSEIIATASSVSSDASMPEKTLDGSGLDENGVHTIATEDMWFTAMGDAAPWIQYEFDGVKKLDVMKVWNSNSSAEGFLGYGVNGVLIEYSTDGQTWATLEDVNALSQAPGLPTYTQYDEIDFGGAAAKMVRLNIQSNFGGFLESYSLSEVQFNMIPAAARTPEPASGSTDIIPNAVVSWRAGREAAQSTVYVSTDVNEVADGLAASATSNANSIDLSSFDLQMGEIYYWRVDEVNNAEAESVWLGPVWSLSIVESIVIDDFESYTNDSPDRPFQVWLDGFGYSADEFFPAGYNGNGTGAGIGHDIWSVASDHYNGNIMETSNTMPGSNQSMPFYYGNSGGVASQTERTFAPGQDWTVGAAQTLSIAFSGQEGNTGTLYVKINNTKLTYPRAATNIAIGAWQAWNIDLTSMNVQNVTTLQIGVDGAGASDMILIDDIRLHPKAGELLTPADPGTNGLEGAWSFDEGSGATVIDSSGNGRNGTIVDATWDTGKQGSALLFNGVSSYVNIDGYKGINAIDTVQQAFTIANWVKTTSDTGDTEMVTWGASSGTAARLTWRVHEGRVRTEHNAGNLRGNTYINDGEWHHVALVVTEGANLRPENTKLYVDGFEDSTFSGADATYNLIAEHDVRIGMSGPQDGRYFPGALDEVRIYDRALSTSEILWLAGKTESFDKPF